MFNARLLDRQEPLSEVMVAHNGKVWCDFRDNFKVKDDKTVVNDGEEIPASCIFTVIGSRRRKRARSGGMMPLQGDLIEITSDSSEGKYVGTVGVATYIMSESFILQKQGEAVKSLVNRSISMDRGVARFGGGNDRWTILSPAYVTDEEATLILNGEVPPYLEETFAILEEGGDTDDTDD